MLNKEPFLRRRSQMFGILIVIMILILLGSCIQIARSTSAVEAATMHKAAHKEAGRVMVQLFQVPGFIYPSISGVPEWTLYDDGLLLFKSNNDSELLQTHLSYDKIRSIMDVILHKNNFFGSTHDTYGHIIPDVGSLLLRVNVNGYSKQVRLYGKPMTAMDEQTQHVFAIRDFLLAYHPATKQLYTPSGIALLVIPQDGDQTNVPVWPYKDISLAQTAARECTYLPGNCTPDKGHKAGILALFGKSGLTLLQRMHDNIYARVKEQGKVYRLIVWPLLPDAFYPRANGEFGIEVQGSASGVWPLYTN